MKVTKGAVGGTAEILAADDYMADPITITETDVVKAGMPVTADGKAAPDGTGAVGILLYDVDPNANPNGSAVWLGSFDWKKCMEHSGATADAVTMKSILPSSNFRTNIGVN